MADGPRCQNRKQTKQRRNNVRTFSKVSEAASDSDDEDKLHIVEEDGVLDTPEEKPTVFELSSAQQLHKRHTLHDCSPEPDAFIQEIKIKEECVTDEEDEKGQKNESLWQGKADVICPDIPVVEHSMLKEEVHDENGTPDKFSHLHSCPYCSRGYKRHTSLKEHIRLRHEKNKDDLCCSICSYTFTYRTQLDRHMNAHKHGKEQRIVSHLGVNRKFKCTECSKAFKYKHHLKEHLRIHSGEKPYECSNCKKRFSHSGSYSSHISSRKCVATPPAVNGLSQDATAKAAVEIDKPLAEQLPAKKIKEEPDEHELEAVKTTPDGTTNNECGISSQTAAPQGVVQTVVLPTVGLVQPISINIRDLQNMLKVSVDGNMMWQAVGSSNGNGVSSKVANPGQPQTQAIPSSHPHLQVISAISLPVLNQDGNPKIIINYSVDPQGSTSALNTAQSILAYQTVAQDKVVDSNRAPPELGEFKSTQCPKLAEPNAAQPNIILTQKPPTFKPVPTQISIIKSTQSAVPNKAASILKVTKLIPGQTKNSQPTLLLLRTGSGPQALVVRQLAAANPQVTVETTGLKATPENTIIAAEKNPVTELNPVAEETSSSRNECQPEDLRSTFLQEVQFQTETRSEIEKNCEESLQIQQEGDRKEGVTATSHSTMAHRSVVCGDGFHNYATCLFCDNSPSSTDGQNDNLNCPNSIEQGSYRSLSSLLGEDGCESSDQPPVKKLLPLLEAYSKDSHPSEEQLSRVAELVSLPRDVVSRWFQRMCLKNMLQHDSENLQNGQQTMEKSQPEPSLGTQTLILDSATELHNEESVGQKSDHSLLKYAANDLCVIKKGDLEEQAQAEPLDLSLSKSVNVAVSAPKPSVPTQEEPLNLTSLKKDTSNGNTIFVTQSTTSPLNIIATPLPTLVAIAEPGGIPFLKAAIATKQRTILIPQLSYTYTSPSTDREVNTPIFSKNKTSTITTSTATNMLGRELNGCEKAKTDAGDESLSGWKEQNDGNLSPIKKKRKIYDGQYACDLCDKVFQKSSSLLRHKYEHTGKRPHECGICKKAFKHKHHLIEHSRLHSGEKPYQCDKCGKRFSHSGSYSQHMNHRYSYCKKVYDEPEPKNASLTPPSQLDSDERESEFEEEIDDYEEPEEEQDGEDDFSGFDMSDIRVVRIGEEYDDDEEEEEEEEEEEDFAELETAEKDVVKTLGTEEHKVEKHIGKPMENEVLIDSIET